MANIKDDAIKAIDLAREVANEKFGADVVHENPHLVTDIALMMAQLHHTRITAIAATKKKPG